MARKAAGPTAQSRNWYRYLPYHKSDLPSSLSALCSPLSAPSPLHVSSTADKSPPPPFFQESEIAALKRQNAQLQSAAASASSSSRRHASSPSVSAGSPPALEELQAQLASRSATIETMELEISRLRAQAERVASAGGTDREQIAALEERLARAEQAAAKAQRELADQRRNLERTAERAVREGSARTSAETQARALGLELDALRADRAEVARRADALEKKVAALGTLHKENDARAQTLRRDKERAELDAREARSAAERLEADNARLRKKVAAAAEDGADPDAEGVEELEDEERARLDKKIRDLEAEVYDLRRGIWHQRRKEMEFGGAADGKGGAGPTSPGFTNIDLGGGLASPTAAGAAAAKRGGLGELFTSGINALAGVGVGGGDHGAHHNGNSNNNNNSNNNSRGGAGGVAGGDDGGFLDDEDFDFDEEAFRRAQEEEARRRLERIRDLKRGLKNWEGWRLDLVETRRGAGYYGVGDVFEI